MPLNYRARCVKEMKQAERCLRKAEHFIAVARASVVAQHKDLGQPFKNIIQDIDHDRHNLMLVTQRIFYRSHPLPYSSVDADAIVKAARPLRHLEHT